jgi:hypothetical protein
VCAFGSVQRDMFVHTKDYKVREPITADIAEVMEGRHHVAGYTGHVHGKQVGA